MMSRKGSIAALVLLAGTTGTAMSQITPTSTVVNNSEVVSRPGLVAEGALTEVEITIAGGSGGDAFATAELVLIPFEAGPGGALQEFGLPADRPTITLADLAAAGNLTVVTEGGGATDVDDTDVYIINLEPFVTTLERPNVITFDLGIDLAGGTTPDIQLVSNADADVGNGAMTDATDERYTLQPNNGPQFTGAFFVNNDGDPEFDLITLTFAHTDADPKAATNLAQFVTTGANAVGTIDATDFVLTGDGGAITINTVAVNASTVEITPAADIATALAGAVTIEVNADGVADGTLRDNLGRVVGQTPTTDPVAGVPASLRTQTIEAAPTFTITDLDFIRADDTLSGDAALDAQLAVTFSSPPDPTDLGNAAFYQQILVPTMATPAGEQAFDVVNVALDPMDPNRVIVDLDFDAGPDGALPLTDGNTRGGTAVTAGADFIATFDQTVGNAPSALLGGAELPAMVTIASIDDMIPPRARIAAFRTNEMGQQNEIVAVFSEPMSTVAPTLGANITVETSPAATAVPFADIDPLSGALPTAVAVSPGIAITEAENNLAAAPTTVPAADVGLTAVDTFGNNNSYSFTLDPTTVDFNGMTDGNPIPGSADAGVFTVTFTTNAVVEDANGNALDVTAPVTLVSNTDDAEPVLVSGIVVGNENVNGGNQFPFESTDAPAGGEGRVTPDTAGPNQTDGASFIFSEAINGGTLDIGPADFRIDGTVIGNPNEAVGGADNNIVTTELATGGNDVQAEAGDPFTLNNVTIEDAAGNEVTALSGNLLDGDAPFVLSQVAAVTSAGGALFGVAPNDANDDGFIDQLVLTFSEAVDPNSVDVDLFEFNGSQLSDMTATATTNGASVTIDLSGAPSNEVPVGTAFTLGYDGSTADATLISDLGDPMATPPVPAASVAAVDTEILVDGAIPTPDEDGPFASVQLIGGSITLGGNPVGSNTKVYGLLTVPVVEGAHIEFDGNSFNITDPDDLAAITDFMLGLEKHLYAVVTGGDPTLVNRAPGDVIDDDDSTIRREVAELELRGNSLTNMTVRGRTISVDNSGRTGGLEVRGSLKIGYDILGSADGSVESLFTGGIGGTPIVSSTVTLDDSGNYELIMTAPTLTTFGVQGMDASTWPIILVVETAFGERFVATSLFLTLPQETEDGEGVQTGPLTFSSILRDSTPEDSPGRFTYDVNLDWINTEFAQTGYNLVGYPSQSGARRSSGGSPTAPAPVGGSEVFTLGNSTLPAANPFDIFVTYIDDDGDGAYTTADDGADFDALQIGPAGDFTAFTLTTAGPRVFSMQNGRVLADTLQAVIGGYGFGYLHTQNNPIGFFQLGEPIAEQISFPNTGNLSNSTFGYLLLTNTDPMVIPLNSGADFTTLNETDFFNDNSDLVADFVLQYDRQSPAMLNIGSISSDGSTFGDWDGQIDPGEVLFFHFDDE